MPNVQCFWDLERFEIIRSSGSVTGGDRNRHRTTHRIRSEERRIP